MKQSSKRTATKGTPTAKQIEEERLAQTAQWVVDFLDSRNMDIAPNIIQDMIAGFLLEAMNTRQFKLLFDTGEGEQVSRDELIAFLRYAEKVGLQVECGRLYEGSDPNPPQPAEDNSLHAFAHHFAEALRIARVSSLIPAALYNGLADALNDFENDLPSLARVSESEPHILIMLEAFHQQMNELPGKEGKRR